MPNCESGKLPLSKRLAMLTMTLSGSSDGADTVSILNLPNNLTSIGDDNQIEWLEFLELFASILGRFGLLQLIHVVSE